MKSETKSNRKKKIIALAIAAALTITLILGGTFAMQDFTPAQDQQPRYPRHMSCD